ncbi:endonuclease/exonuclease/phosphatase family [Sodiomyces alkalinus F11]|uniref:Endonuclease/exonuclease/phosphatase family n=1 Tax=Sodiomyces alkalinus (strain CBS 110278 / VKM F-3762 / F11) TaxID=1314773 RepID=A0A3N2Q2H2_SODAK|nr:endonuclease/exonuclease/phosphatase family [Sodiomyces alkalinus F11]ROT40937.1 endonuclease/exonuclease/phosphatase family [Sodiomyces alkalinus F11]
MRVFRTILPAVSAVLLAFGADAHPGQAVRSFGSPSETIEQRQLGGSLALVEGEELFTFAYSTPEPYGTNWIGLYRASGGGPVNEEYTAPSLAWSYAPETQGTVRLSTGGLEPGDYVAFFLARDVYKWLAEPLNVTLPKPPPKPLAFRVSEATLHNARQGDPFEAHIAGFVSGPDDGSVTFSKVDGADWVEVSHDGVITGTPDLQDADATVTVVASVQSTSSNETTASIRLTIPVRPAGAPLVETLRVLSFNMRMGGTRVNGYHEKQTRFLLESNVDIVGLQEDQNGGRHAERLAKALGWHRWSSPGSVGVLSRYPVAEAYGQVVGGNSAGVRIALDGPSQQVNVWVVHLGYTPYGPYDFCFDGMDVDTVLGREAVSGRTPQITNTLAAMQSQLDAAHKVPVLLLGDFNAPSHLDWTEALREKNCGFADVPWPTSVKPAEAGLVDSFRAANPDPVAVPGISWSPLFPFHDGATGRPEPQDRIDFIYHKGSLTVVNSKDVVVGEPRPYPYHRDNEWTSDHAAMLTSYKILPRLCVPRPGRASEL